MYTQNLLNYIPTVIDHALPVMALPGAEVQMSLSAVSFQIFPLRASMARLTEFCDLYLNFTHDGDRPPYYFRPALPYVLLQIIDYGRMAIEWQNEGWFGANELVFTIPLEWYLRNGSQYWFINWATISPYIFADNPLSIRNGREVYGWPKVAMQVAKLAPYLNPVAMRPVVSLSLELPFDPNSNASSQLVPFLDVVREPPNFQSILHFSRDSITAVPKALAGSMSMMTDAALSLTDLANARTQGFPGPGYLHAGSDIGFQYLRDIMPTVMGGGRSGRNPQPIGYTGNIVNLKQFRDAEDPNTACYQAITLSRMTLEKINDGGLLVDPTTTDPPSGRYLLRLFDQAMQPIVETLGLEVARQTDVGGRTAAILEPQVPFWMSADLSYGQGETLSWRSRCSRWSQATPLPTNTDDPAIQYVPMGSGALQEIAAPFTFPVLTMRVLPMLAEPDKLSAFCADYLSTKTLGDIPYSIKPWGRFVYLLAASYDGLTARLNSARLTADREVAIILPVSIHRGTDCLGVALLPAFTFAGNQVAAITDREVYGRPTLMSDLNSPATLWLDSHKSPDDLQQPLLRICTELLPSNFVGAKVVNRAVLEIDRGGIRVHTDLEEAYNWRWAHTLLSDYRCKADTALENPRPLDIVTCSILEILFSGKPLYSIALKQFMDASDLSKSCFQSLVQVSRVVESVRALGEFVHPLYISIPKYETLGIVDQLGLKVTETTIKYDPEIGNVMVENIEPIRPFWITTSMSGKDGRNRCLRAGVELTWHTNSDCGSVLADKPLSAGGRLPFGPGFFDAVEQGSEEQPVQTVAQDWLRLELAKELHQFRTLGEDVFERPLQFVDLLRSLPTVEPTLAPDNPWTAFLSSYRVEDLLRVVDELARQYPAAVNPSKRYTSEELAEAIKIIEPQIALEYFLNQDKIIPPDPGDVGGAPYPKRKTMTPHDHTKGRQPYRIRRDSAEPHFECKNTQWTGCTDHGDEQWYWEKEREMPKQDDAPGGNTGEAPEGDEQS